MYRNNVLRFLAEIWPKRITSRDGCVLLIYLLVILCIGNEKCARIFFGTNFLNTAGVPGHPDQNPGTSQIPLFETQGRQTFEGGHEVFGHHPFPWKTPTPPGSLRTQKVNNLLG